MISIWGAGLGETRRPGKHRGGNVHGNGKAKPSGKHLKAAAKAKAAKGGRKK